VGRCGASITTRTWREIRPPAKRVTTLLPGFDTIARGSIEQHKRIAKVCLLRQLHTKPQREGKAWHIGTLTCMKRMQPHFIHGHFLAEIHAHPRLRHLWLDAGEQRIELRHAEERSIGGPKGVQPSVRFFSSQRGGKPVPPRCCTFVPGARLRFPSSTITSASAKVHRPSTCASFVTVSRRYRAFVLVHESPLVPRLAEHGPPPCAPAAGEDRP